MSAQLSNGPETLENEQKVQASFNYQGHGRNSLQLNSNQFSELKRESAPHTLKKGHLGDREYLTEESPQHTQEVETAETLKQLQSVNDDEQVAQITEYEALPQIEALRPDDHQHIEFICSQINQQDRQSSLQNQMMEDGELAGGSIAQSCQVKSKKEQEKNFVNENAVKVKTLHEIQQQNSAKRYRKTYDVAMRQQFNPYGYKFMGVTENTGLRKPKGEQQVYRSEEWSQLTLINKEASKIVKENSAFKNLVTNQAFVKPPSTPKSNQTLFSRNSKDLAWNTRNQSFINMLPSVKTLDMVDRKSDEKKLIASSQGNVELSHKLHLASAIFDQGETCRAKNIPSEYSSYKPKPQILQNFNNKDVEIGRSKTYSSSGF